MRVATITLVAAALLALAGCSDTGPDAPAASAVTTPQAPVLAGEQTASPSPMETAPQIVTPSPSPTPAAADGDPCQDPTVSATGLAPIDYDRYGSICLGMSFAEASEAMPGPAIAGNAACPWYADVLIVDDPGLYVSAVTRPDAPGEEIYLFRMQWLGNPLDAASFPAPETTRGISVGSTPGEVQAAYPDAVTVSVEDPSQGTRTQMLSEGGDGAALVFDVTAGRVTTMFWGTGITSGAAGELCAL